MAAVPWMTFGHHSCFLFARRISTVFVPSGFVAKVHVESSTLISCASLFCFQGISMRNIKETGMEGCFESPGNIERLLGFVDVP